MNWLLFFYFSILITLSFNRAIKIIIILLALREDIKRIVMTLLEKQISIGIFFELSQLPNYVQQVQTVTLTCSGSLREFVKRTSYFHNSTQGLQCLFYHPVLVLSANQHSHHWCAIFTKCPKFGPIFVLQIELYFLLAHDFCEVLKVVSFVAIIIQKGAVEQCFRQSGRISIDFVDVKQSFVVEV